jgi:two-component system, cell cycle response regulator DivK
LRYTLRSSVGHRILYVEDNPANLALVTKVLEHAGDYRVTGVTTGEEGLEHVRRELPDLLLLDLDLPGIDGFEVARRIKQDPALKSLPVVAITASVMKQERRQALEAGCVGFIEKPFDIEELRRLVADAIEGTVAAP